VLNRFSILRLNRGEVALGSFYFFTHPEKLLLNSKTPPEGGVLFVETTEFKQKVDYLRTQ
jgi:hypothetical protein